MEKKEIAIEGPLTVGDTKVYVIAEMQIGCTSNNDRLECFGTRMPIYVVIISDSARKAFTVGGEEVAIEYLIETIADLQKLFNNRYIR